MTGTREAAVTTVSVDEIIEAGSEPSYEQEINIRFQRENPCRIVAIAKAVLATMPPEDAQIARLVFLEEARRKDVHEKMGVTLQRVYAVTRRFKERLIKMMKEMNEADIPASRV